MAQGSHTKKSRDAANYWLPTTLAVEKAVENVSRRRGDKSEGICSRCLANPRVICLIIIYALVATGLWTFFLRNPFSLPGRDEQISKLNDQVEMLDEEVDRLETQVGRLNSELSRLSNETDRLEYINDELTTTVSSLNATIFLLAELNPELNSSIFSQEEQMEILKSLVSQASDISETFAGSMGDLGDTVATLTKLNSELMGTTVSLEEEKTQWKQIALSLQESNGDLASKSESLDTQLGEAKAQNEALAKNNDDLRSILSFLNQAGLDLNATVEGLADFLSEEIHENNALVLRDLELSYQSIYFYWVCASTFDDVFGGRSWETDTSLPIGADDYYELMDFIDENIFTDTCASKEDFVNFLVSDEFIGYNGSSPPVNISFNILKSTLERYSAMQMKFYFSFEDDGLSKDHWVDAEFDCRNLALENRFAWAYRR